LDEVLVISGIIKVKVGVISHEEGLGGHWFKENKDKDSMAWNIV